MPGAFTENKTLLPNITPVFNFAASSGGNPPFPSGIISFTRISNDVVQLNLYNYLYAHTDLVAVLPMSFEIKVYY